LCLFVVFARYIRTHFAEKAQTRTLLPGSSKKVISQVSARSAARRQTKRPGAFQGKRRVYGVSGDTGLFK